MSGKPYPTTAAHKHSLLRSGGSLASDSESEDSAYAPGVGGSVTGSSFSSSSSFSTSDSDSSDSSNSSNSSGCQARYREHEGSSVAADSNHTRDNSLPSLPSFPSLHLPDSDPTKPAATRSLTVVPPTQSAEAVSTSPDGAAQVLGDPAASQAAKAYPLEAVKTVVRDDAAGVCEVVGSAELGARLAPGTKRIPYCGVTNSGSGSSSSSGSSGSCSGSSYSSCSSSASSYSSALSSDSGASMQSTPWSDAGDSDLDDTPVQRATELPKPANIRPDEAPQEPLFLQYFDEPVRKATADATARAEAAAATPPGSPTEAAPATAATAAATATTATTEEAAEQAKPKLPVMSAALRLSKDVRKERHNSTSTCLVKNSIQDPNIDDLVFWFVAKLIFDALVSHLSKHS